MHIIWDEMWILQSLSKPPPDIWQVGTISVVGEETLLHRNISIVLRLCFNVVKANIAVQLNRELSFSNVFFYIQWTATFTKTINPSNKDALVSFV